MGGGIKKLENALTQYASRAVGANAVTRELSVAMGGMAVGGGPLTAVILAIGAVVTVYERLTKASKDAEASVKRLADAMKVQAAGPGGQTAIDVDVVRAENIRLRGQRQRLRDNLPAEGVLRDLDLRRISELTKQIGENQKVIGFGQGEVNKAIDAAKPKLDAVHAKTVKIKEATFDMAETWHKVADILTDIYNNPFTREGARAINQAANDTLNQALSKDLSVPVDISDSVKIANDQAKSINDVAKRNTETIANAVVSSAAVIVNALNIGGGGRGSSIGGALGGVAGTALGTMAAGHIGSTFGSLIAPGIGTIVGSLAGSLIGGLFDHHKKAVDSNTKAIQQLTAQLQNAPTGYRVDSDRFNATNARDTYNRAAEGAARASQRGGATVWQAIHGMAG